MVEAPDAGHVAEQEPSGCMPAADRCPPRPPGRRAPCPADIPARTPPHERALTARPVRSAAGIQTAEIRSALPTGPLPPAPVPILGWFR
ncbi:hypothetical protein GCM10022221_31310 [Actinocorallia aurea]